MIMKTRFFLISLLFSLILSNSLFGQDPYESNDSFTDAYPIEFDIVYDEGTIFPVGDTDFYEVYVPQGAVLEFNGLEFPSNLEMRATIYDCQSPLCSLTTLELFNNVTRYYKVCTEGFYYIEVFDAGNNEASQSIYSFGLTIDSDDVYEYDGCNDLITIASEIELDQPIQGAINAFGDRDFYSFHVPTESVIRIFVNNIHDEISMTTVLYDGPSLLNEIEPWTSNFSGIDVDRYWKICTPGTYYLQLFDQVDNDRSGQLYNLIVEIDSTDTCEFNGCNDLITTACEIEVNQPIQAAINSFGDLDFYSFDVSTESIINIKVDNINDEISMTTVLYDAPSLSNEIETWTSLNSGNDVNRFWKICTPGTYYIRLSDNGDNNRSSQLYNLEIEMDSSDIYECNDTEDTAYELEICSDTLFAAINLVGDEEFFSFTAPADININIEITDIANNIDMELELEGPNGEIELASGNNGSDVSLSYLTSEEGTYILHLSDAGNNEFDPALYQIVINLVPEVNLPAEFENICLDDTSITLSGGTPLDGIYSGPGVDAMGNFDPSIAGAGLHSITYTYTDAVSGCTSSSSADIFVNELPEVNLMLPDFCINDAPTTLNGGDPSGGIYTGTGVDAQGDFDPINAGVGINNISYSYTDPNTGCSNIVEDSITVYDLTPVTVSFPTDTVFFNDAPFQLSGGEPANGDYTGDGVNGSGIFNPSIGIGTFEITYSFTDANNCTNSATDFITVIQATSIHSISWGQEISVAPNPFTERFKISLPNKTNTTIVAAIFDTKGSLVFSKEYNPIDELIIESGHLPKGIYFLKLKSKDQFYFTKLLKH